MRRAALLVPALLLLAACGGEATPAADSSTPSSAAVATPTSAPTAEPSAPGAEAAAGGDVTAELQALARDVVTSAEQTEPDRIVVQTSITDPRGDGGSPEAQQAINACRAAVQLLTIQGVAEPKVSVSESDGTSLVLAGHPAYGPDCTEV